MKNNLSRLVPAILLSVSVFAGTTFAVGEAMKPAEEVNAVDYEEVTFGEGTFLITTVKDGTSYYLPAATNTSSAPAAKSFTDVSSIEESNLWTVTLKSSGNYSIQNSDGAYLYATDKNNGIRIGTGHSDAEWTYNATDNYLKFATLNRYVGIYDVKDWRCYSSATHNNYGGSAKNLKFYRKVVSTTNYEVGLNVGKGSFKDANEVVDFVGNLDGSSTITLPSKEKVNGAYGVAEYELLHWVDNDGVTYEPGSTYTITSNQTLKAVYNYEPTISVSQVWKIIDGLANKEETEAALTVRGTFNGEYYTDSHNVAHPFIEETVDGTTYKIELYNATGATADDVLYTGCNVILTSKFTKYNSTYESVNGATYTVVKEPRIVLELDANSKDTLYVGGTDASLGEAQINATVTNVEGYTINWVYDENVFEVLAMDNEAVFTALVGGKTETVTAQVMVAGAVVASESMTLKTVAVKKLATPVVSYDELSNVLSWNAVEGAIKYQLDIYPADSTEAVVSQELEADVVSYIPSVAAGNYEVSLVAKGNGLDIIDSEMGIGSFTYQESATVAFAKSVSEIKTNAKLGMTCSSAMGMVDKMDTMHYSGSTVSPKEGDDLVSKYNLGLDTSVYNIVVHKGEGSTVPALNSDGSFRLYANGTYAVVTSTNVISSITLHFTTASYNGVSVYHSVGDTNAITGEGTDTTKTYVINSNSFVLMNNSSSQARVKTMDINYSVEEVVNSYSNTRARFVVNVPAEVYENAVLTDANPKWGVAITINEKTIDVVMGAENIVKKDDGSYEFVASVTNIPAEEFKTMIKAVGYVEYTYNGETVRNEMTATEYSIETMVQTYLANAASMGLTSEQIEVLNDFQKQYSLAA